MARSMPSTPLASTRSIAPAAKTRSASSTSPQHHPPNQPQLGSIHHPQNQIGVSTLGSQSRRKESSLINQWYVSLYGCAPVELWSTRLSCPQIHRRISSLPQQLPSA